MMNPSSKASVAVLLMNKIGNCRNNPFFVGAVVTGFKVGAGVGSHFTGGILGEVGLGVVGFGDVVSSTNFTSNDAPSTLVIVT